MPIRGSRDTRVSCSKEVIPINGILRRNFICSILITAAEILGVTVHQALEDLGDYFVTYAAKQGYSKLLHSLGSNFIEFLHNLNNLHLHLSMSFEAMIPPAFRCEQVQTSIVDHRVFLIASDQNIPT